MPSVPAGAGRYLRTVAHLRPEQLVHRVRLRAQQEALRRWPSAFERRWLHPGEGQPAWPVDFAAIDALLPPETGSIDELEAGTFRFLNETRTLGDPVVWDPVDASQLWLYHQHYWEWAWTLLAHPDRARAQEIFGAHLRSWLQATRFGRWNAWAPYPTSLRSWVFVNVADALVIGTPLEDEFRLVLRQHAGFVERNLEHDVGGNHLVKNLKALVGLGVYFGDGRLLDRASGLLRKQVGRQVLADGGHFELSPSYHCQVLGDLIDVQGLFASAGHASIDGFDAAIGKMRWWLGAMLMPDGDVPVFNDCERLGAARVRQLDPAPRPVGALVVLAESGYALARPSERIHLVVDVGDPCPGDLPAHAQADCLTFELAVDGERVVVDPGTSGYGSGVQRRWERSTAAHNTVTVDGTDQTEVWGAFRAGRLARATLESARESEEAVVIVASHDGYRALPGEPTHRRRWNVGPDELVITDTLEGTGVHDVSLRLLIDEAQVEQVDAQTLRLRCGPVEMGAKDDSVGGDGIKVERARYAVAHGDHRGARALEGRWRSSLPLELRTSIQLTPGS